MLAWPAWNYGADERAITTPALEISDAWRAAALPVGVALMAAFAALRLAQLANLKLFVQAMAVVLGIVAAFWFARPLFEGLGRLNLLIFFVGVAAGSVLAGVPIAFAFGLGTFGYLALTTSTPLEVLVGRMDEGMSHLILLAVPLFVFLGLLIEMTGMARAMVDFLAGLLGHVRGGLSYVLRRGDVSGFRHFGLEGRRHGGGRAGAVSRNEAARCQARRPGRTVIRHWRA